MTHIQLPVMRPRLPNVASLLPYLRRIDQNRIYANYGPLALEFEARVAAHLGLARESVVSASSGTAALVGAILATAGRATTARPYALVPSFTFTATASAIEQCGYTPYFVDIDAESWMLAPARLADHPILDRTGVVVAVAPFGRTVPHGAWQDFQDRTGVPVVIDGAASFTVLQAFGRLPVAISFHATKGFGIGEGGAVICSDVELVKRAMQALNFGFAGGTRECLTPSTNGKLSEYHAAVGLAQFDEWPETRARFEAVAKAYRIALAGFGCDRSFWATPDVGISYGLFLCESGAEATLLRERLHQDGVQSRLWYGTGLHDQGYYSSAERDRLEVTEDIAARLIGIPMSVDLGEDDVVRIADALYATRRERSISDSRSLASC